MTAANQPSSDSAARRGWRYSLRGLLITVLGAAIGLAMARREAGQWTDVPWAVAATWIVLGLINQVRDLWAVRGSAAELPSEVRWGWRYAIAWRIAVVGTLTGHYVAEPAYWMAGLGLSEPEWGYYFSPKVQFTVRDGVFLLSVILPLASATRSGATRRRPQRANNLILPIALCAAMLICLVIATRQMLIAFLVHVAVTGIDAAQMDWTAPVEIKPDTAANIPTFIWFSSVAMLCAPVALAAILRLAPRTSPGRWRRTWVAMFIVSLGILIAYSIWVYTTGLRSISPHMADAVLLGPWHQWFWAVALMALVAAAAAFRMVQHIAEPEPQSVLWWRRSEPRYYHERAATVALAMLSAAVQIIESFMALSREAPADLRGVLATLMVDPTHQLRLALIIFAMYGLVRQILPARHPSTVGVAPLPICRFVMIWLATLILITTTAVALEWFAFSLWLTPWYRLPLP